MGEMFYCITANKAIQEYCNCMFKEILILFEILKVLIQNFKLNWNYLIKLFIKKFNAKNIKINPI